MCWLSLLGDKWIATFVKINVYILAGVFCIKEVLFEYWNQGIEQRLLREIEESPLIRKVGSKIAVVTGADGTIGQEIVRKLLKYKFTVHALVGDIAKARILFRTERMQQNEVTPTLKLYGVNLFDPLETLNFAEEFACGSDQISLVIMAAGVMFAPEKQINQVESHMCINVVAQALLINIISQNLGPQARIAWLGSSCARVAHRIRMDNNENFMASYIGPHQAYAYSKLVLSAYTEQLARRDGLPIVSVHPGVIPGGLYRHTNFFVKLVVLVVLPFLLRKPRFGALLVLHTALRQDFHQGSYYEDTHIKNVYERLTVEQRKQIYDGISAKIEYWQE